MTATDLPIRSSVGSAPGDLVKGSFHSMFELPDGSTMSLHGTFDADLEIAGN